MYFGSVSFRFFFGKKDFGPGRFINFLQKVLYDRYLADVM